MAKKTGRRSFLEPAPRDLIRAALWERGRLTRGEAAEEGDCTPRWADKVLQREIAKGNVRYDGPRAPGKQGVYVHALREAWDDGLRLGHCLKDDEEMMDLDPGDPDLRRLERLLQPQNREALRGLLGTLYLFRLVLNRDPWEEVSGMDPLPRSSS